MNYIDCALPVYLNLISSFSAALPLNLIMLLPDFARVFEI